MSKADVDLSLGLAGVLVAGIVFHHVLDPENLRGGLHTLLTDSLVASITTRVENCKAGYTEANFWLFCWAHSRSHLLVLCARVFLDRLAHSRSLQLHCRYFPIGVSSGAKSVV
jgi:hypothetical protein